MVLADEAASWQVAGSEQQYAGAVVGVRRDQLVEAGGGTFAREVVIHPGAVAVVALDGRGRVLLVRQYRHPVGQRLVELPAGLLDVAGEDPLSAARRELLEEGRVTAARWEPLLELLPSPGISSEAVSIFLAEGIAPGPDDGSFVAEHEEAGLTRSWEPLRAVVDAVLDRRIKNALLAAGVLAVYARGRGG